MDFTRNCIKAIKSINIGGWILICIGTVVWSLTMVKSGINYSYGMGFWGPNGHDGVWHIALIEGLIRDGLQMPVFKGELIQNYHIGFDVIVAVLHKLTFIPVTNLYFQVLPPVLALSIGLLVYKFTLVWKKSDVAAFWSTFFVYFGGSLGWIVNFVRNGSFDGESMFWSQQSISTLINPPFALSLLTLFAGLIFLKEGIAYKSMWRLTTASLLFGLLVQIKVYAGLLILGGLFISGMHSLVNKKGPALLKVFTGTLIISVLAFSPLHNTGSGNIVFRPFWFLETMMNDIDRVYWPRFGGAMGNYVLAGNWLKAVTFYFAAFLIFIVGNFGLRIIKGLYVINNLKNWKQLKYMDVIFVSIILLGIVVPLFFIQSGTVWNTIQFFYYSLTFSGILAGIVLSNVLARIPNNKLKSLVMLFVVILTMPTTLATLGYHYLPTRPPAKISNTELEALKYLRQQSTGTVLTLPFNKDAAIKAVDNPPRPLYLYESTAYVSAFSNKPVYLEDEVNLEITGYNWRDRRQNILDVLNSDDSKIFHEFTENEQIKYIYAVRETWSYGNLLSAFTKVYENDEVVIYEVQ